MELKDGTKAVITKASELVNLTHDALHNKYPETSVTLVVGIKFAQGQNQNDEISYSIRSFNPFRGECPNVSSINWRWWNYNNRWWTSWNSYRMSFLKNKKTSQVMLFFFCLKKKCFEHRGFLSIRIPTYFILSCTLRKESLWKLKDSKRSFCWIIK